MSIAHADSRVVSQTIVSSYIDSAMSSARRSRRHFLSLAVFCLCSRAFSRMSLSIVGVGLTGSSRHGGGVLFLKSTNVLGPLQVFRVEKWEVTLCLSFLSQ